MAEGTYTDHDLLIRIDERVKTIHGDVQELRHGQERLAEDVGRNTSRLRALEELPDRVTANSQAIQANAAAIAQLVDGLRVHLTSHTTLPAGVLVLSRKACAYLGGLVVLAILGAFTVQVDWGLVTRATSVAKAIVGVGG